MSVLITASTGSLANDRGSRRIRARDGDPDRRACNGPTARVDRREA